MKTKYNQQKSIFLFVQQYAMLWLLLFCISTITTYAQSPQKMTYQSVVRDASGNLLADTAVGIQISILQGSASGATVYSETYSPNPQTNINGLVSLEVGGGTPSGALFSNIDWANGPYFLKVDIDPLGGTSYTITGISQLLSVPYALYAETSGNANTNGGWSLSGNTGTNPTNNFIGTTDNQELKFRIENEPFGELNRATNSVFFGEQAGLNSAGIDNIGIGKQALKDNTAGFNNIGLGSSVLLNNAGAYNIGIGSFTLRDNTTGNRNIGMGHLALRDNTTGSDNIGMGNSALQENTSGTDNIGMGNEALTANTTGGNNIGMGNGALRSNTDGFNNIGIGEVSLGNNTTGIDNIGMGRATLAGNTTGRDNIGMGRLALVGNTTGDNNIGMGFYTLWFNTTGNDNIGMGYHALWHNTTGDDNIGIGYHALSTITTGSNNIGIGQDAEVNDPTGSNQVRIGNTLITSAEIQVAWTVTSDKKWKEHIRPLPYGLDLVSQLEPVDYVRKNNEAKTREIGFIAQDVEKLLTTVGYTEQGFLTKDSKGNLSLRYNDFIPLLTKAIQELNDSNKSLQKMNIELVKRIEKLEQQN